MLFKSYPGTRKELDLLTAIAPVYRLDAGSGNLKLIGTGFWVTKAGHLVTAWHVVNENIGPDGVDRGPIFAIQIFPDHSVAVRGFRQTDKHPQFDLALSETVSAPPHVGRPTSPIAMSLDDLCIGDPVFSFAVLPHDQVFKNEDFPGITTAVFSGEASVDSFAEIVTIKFAVRLSFGRVTAIFEKMRDRVMLPFPCVQSDVPIYGGNSGGPVFDVSGRICAINCTSFEGNDIAFHIPVRGVLHLRTRSQSLGVEDSSRKQRSILELGALGTILFDPPMLDADRFAHSVLRWLWYAVKCLIRRERPSINVHLATSAPKGRPSDT
jgi:Trypsin-like peptidase domain